MAGLLGAGWRTKLRRPAAAASLSVVIAAGLTAAGALRPGTVQTVGAGPPRSGPPRSGPPRSGPASRGRPTISSRTTTSRPTTTTLPPLALASITPADKTKDLRPRTPLVVKYSRRPGPAARKPRISPATPGGWSKDGARTLVFRPSVYWHPGTTYRVFVPLRTGTKVFRFTVRLPSVLTLQQYLAELGYLPLRFTPTGDVPNRKAVLAEEPTEADLVPQVPAAGVFTWAFPGIPASLWQLWHRAKPNVLTTGAVTQFETAQGLSPDGVAGPLVWHSLLEAVALREMDAHPYDYVIVSEALPETLYVWQDGKFVYSTLTNTGVPGANTPEGTWPVAYKQNPNLMKGCDVNGSCYSVWVNYASYFLPSIGDAIHAYSRPGYGYPQSNGCVEVPPSQGAVVYGYDPLGTPVTVTSWVGPAQRA
jgi:peptidoglycan hydrolase-like protein with peptidoglycan-binding domain